MEAPKTEQLNSENTQEDFNEKINEELDFLLEATNAENALDRVSKCERETRNTARECFNDILMPIKQALLIMELVCKKYKKDVIIERDFVNLKKKYEEMEILMRETTKSLTIKDIGLIISGKLAEMNKGTMKIKEEQLYRKSIEIHIDNIFKATEIGQALKELHECKKRTHQNSVKLCFTDFITKIDYNIQAMEIKRTKRKERKESVVSDKDIDKIIKTLGVLKLAFADVRKDEECGVEDTEEIISLKLKNLRDVVEKIRQKLK